MLTVPVSTSPFGAREVLSITEVGVIESCIDAHGTWRLLPVVVFTFIGDAAVTGGAVAGSRHSQLSTEQVTTVVTNDNVAGPPQQSSLTGKEGILGVWIKLQRFDLLYVDPQQVV